MTGIKINKGYIPGAIGRIVELHGRYYHQHWEFDSYFETKVATGLSEFINRYDETRDGFWTANEKGRVEGTITIDGVQAESRGAHLRWFIISDRLRGQGIGQRLMNLAVDFCREKEYPAVYLWTFEGLHAARYLYDKAGFRVVEQRLGKEWGIEVNEQRLTLTL
ncbi:MAG: GNAT family N-acetyltransferase [Thermodesulfobacteriota bacterium]|nr:GNAT family N-acetyltransferase [Thermodesulfobacteriota bacterium]